MTLNVPDRFAYLVTEYVAKLEREEREEALKGERSRKGREFWNSRLDWINGHLTADKDEYAHFKWTQLVDQEMWMWVAIGQPVPRSGFDWLCDRRGFNAAQRQFLKEFLEHVGLRAAKWE